MKRSIMSGLSIVDGMNTAAAAKGRNPFDVDALVRRTRGNTTGETNHAAPAGDIVVILRLHEAEVVASA
ncbi:MAG: hypothetical protein QOD90_2951 [Mycobacterium sp.]|jgi:hypothetical protein|nr:hypothetical protein [Mycobacterium sp.]